MIRHRLSAEPCSQGHSRRLLNPGLGIVEMGQGVSQRYVDRRAAVSMAVMSIFFIVIIASIARFAAAPSWLFIASSKARGVICQEKPYLSLPQPHALSSPPLSTIAFQYRSVSA